VAESLLDFIIVRSGVTGSLLLYKQNKTKLRAEDI
jgi:hypothetical protein